MGLARVALPTSDFDVIHDHLSTHRSNYLNMHLRETCQRNRVRDLRYLHALRVVAGQQREIEGMISGPGVFWHYKLIRTRMRTQINVFAEVGSSKELTRIEARFLPEIMKRVRQEQTPGPLYTNYSAGQYYLKRRASGMAATHSTCRAAVDLGVVDQRLVATLVPWKFALVKG